MNKNLTTKNRRERMEKTKGTYYCFNCGSPMEELPHLPKEILSSLIVRLGCEKCNIVQEKNYLLRKLGLNDHGLSYREYVRKFNNV